MKPKSILQILLLLETSQWPAVSRNSSIQWAMEKAHFMPKYFSAISTMIGKSSSYGNSVCPKIMISSFLRRVPNELIAGVSGEGV